MFLRSLCQLRSGKSARSNQKIKQHTNLKVMLVGQRILNRLNQRLLGQNLLRHLVHSVLDTGAVVMRKSGQGNIPSLLPGRLELVRHGAHLIETAKVSPVPISRDIGAENTIPGLRETGVFVTDEAPELRVGALEHGQAADGGADIDALALDNVNLDVAGLLAVLDERVRVRLAVDVHASEAVGDDLGVGLVDVVVAGDEVVAQDGTEELGRSHWVLAGEDVDGVFDGVGCDNAAVVGFGVAVLISIQWCHSNGQRTSPRSHRRSARRRWSRRRSGAWDPSRRDEP